MASSTVHYIGKLTVTAHQAKDLKNVNLMDAMDPYAKLQMNKESFKTKVHTDAGSFPRWEQTFIFNLDAKGNELFQIEVLTKNTLSDGKVGRASLELDRIIKNQSKQWIQLMDPDNFNKMAGQIELTFSYSGSNEPPKANTTTAPAAQPAAAPVVKPVPAPPQPVVVVQQTPGYHPQPVYAPAPVVQQPGYAPQPYPQPGYAPSPYPGQPVYQPAPGYSPSPYPPQAYPTPMMQPVYQSPVPVPVPVGVPTYQPMPVPMSAPMFNPGKKAFADHFRLTVRPQVAAWKNPGNVAWTIEQFRGWCYPAYENVDKLVTLWNAGGRFNDNNIGVYMSVLEREIQNWKAAGNTAWTIDQFRRWSYPVFENIDKLDTVIDLPMAP